MNPAWEDFLRTQQIAINHSHPAALPSENWPTTNHVMPVLHLSVLKVGGNDAAKFLQGQMTCNVNDVSDTQSSVGAFCNPKGRAISTFLLSKTDDAYWLVLPFELLAIVQNHLRKYILRSDVTLVDCSNELCLFGILTNNDDSGALFATKRNDLLKIRFSEGQNRHLFVAEAETAIRHWRQLVEQAGYQTENANGWKCLDIQGGIPWLGTATSEEFIPQMLNLDRLHGISFNKGCYTGQEVVARTHYLGKAKRALYLLESVGDYQPEANAALFDPAGNPRQTVGHVVNAIRFNNRCLMQAVLLQNENTMHEPSFQDRPDLKIRILPFVS